MLAVVLKSIRNTYIKVDTQIFHSIFLIIPFVNHNLSVIIYIDITYNLNNHLLREVNKIRC